MKLYEKITAKVLVFLVLFLYGFLGICFGDFGQGFYPAQVKDISDRKYEATVIELLDTAKESIVMSMYTLSSGTEPVRLLIRDLEEALDRGVSVEMYLNTRFNAGSSPWGISGEAFDALREKGAKIFEVTHSRRLHDKLIIVDRRYVVEGSTNWSVSALKDNYESAVLIDSPELAIEKLVRIKRLMLEGGWAKRVETTKNPERLVLFSEDSVVILNKSLLEDKAFFPSMVTKRARRAMDTYLLLKAYAVRQGANKFFVSLESLALELDMPVKWSNTDKRRQVIRVLKQLQDKYKLIDVDFGHGKDALVNIREIPGDTFEIKGSFFAPEVFSKLSSSNKFIVLIKALLEKEHTLIDSLTFKAISDRFHVCEETVSKEIKAMEKTRTSTPRV